MLYIYIYIYIFGALAPSEFCPVQYSLYVQVLHSPILAMLLHSTPAAGIGQTLWRGTRNGISELSQRAPPIFGWAATTLGIGQHSSLPVTAYLMTTVAYNFTAIKTPLMSFHMIVSSEDVLLNGL